MTRTDEPVALFWFRRDLRLDDNVGLFHALKSGYSVLPVFIFDRSILEKLEDRHDRRLSFIHGAIESLQKKITAAGSSLRVMHGTPEQAMSQLLAEYDVRAVYANSDYEPYAVERDRQIGLMLDKSGVPFHTLKDQVIFEKNEVVKSDGTPYTVFTPYSRVWKKKLTQEDLTGSPSEQLMNNLVKTGPFPLPSLEEIGFAGTDLQFSAPVINTSIIADYQKTRNIPSLDGTTRLGIHLRFGTVSIRRLVATAIPLSEVWLNELIWREFFMSILWHFPHVVDNSFRKKYDNIRWRNNEEDFERWCNGMTGYPIVDAGMRELNATGFMHNRVRMITASFLTKHLLTDWRWGEAYFAARLLDYELSSNNGNWQWAAGSGCDAAPYFRVFNPSEQTGKFDPDLVYIRRWVPEHETPEYPRMIVDHALARERALKTYSEGIR
ncbi:MAG: deoxyribodipyrimidine photo-lyase [Bacteroidales bacterium]|nr:deoxyribodipyrimidine photo-lyase [Bacteroidales bacterium]MDT8374195.1 deoxyribodipyrimidine photo-lyase [Bacteroidales bacterium]